MRALAFASILAATACVHTPSPLDVKALIARRGPEEARRDLAIRVLDDPRDVQARLALAALAEQVGRPTEAIEQLEAVERLGGPLGVRWNSEDRTRLGRLLLARGRARLARGAPAALADLERARSLGAPPSADELVSARIAQASSLVRHVDGKLRARGRAIFASLAKAGPAGTEESAWLGARDGASPAERGAFGLWLWSINARRESYDQLAAWHAGTPAPRDETLQAAYLRAFAWWVPLWLGEAEPPPAEDLVGAERCRFPGADCAPPVVEPAPLPPLADADAGVSGTRLALVAAVRYAATRITVLTSDASIPLHQIAGAYGKDPAIADRLGRDLVARSTDAALGYATLGALFDALGDRPRARAAWQAAAALSDESVFARGLAEAAGRAGDGPAALIFATTAGAWSGDPAVVWTAVAAALRDGKQLTEALTAIRSAVDLAGPDQLPRVLELGTELSRSLGRESQANAFELQRAQLAIVLAPRGTKPSEALAAVLAYRARPNAVTTAGLWVAARAHPRDVDVRAALLEALEHDDARRAVILRDLLELAGDESPERALGAVRALQGE